MCAISKSVCVTNMNLFITILAQIIQVITGQQYFRVKPHDTSVVSGRTAELHCHVGNRVGFVQWSKDGFLLGYDPEIPGYERYEMRVDDRKSVYTLLVHGARLEDEAEFQCQVGPGLNEKPIRSVARLTVLVPPKHLSINNLPDGSEMEVRQAEKVVLQCQALSSKPATILKWYRKNIELMPEASRTTVRRESEKLYSTLSSITLYPKGDISGGSTYTCEALHPALENPMKTTVNVAVVVAPSYIVIEGPSESSIGESVTLKCRSATTNQPAELTWLVDGVPFQPQFSSSHPVENGWFTTSNLTTIITRQKTDVKVFTCLSQNSPRREKDFKTFNVSILYPPEAPTITGYEEHSNLREGDQQNLTCSALAGNPAAQMRWYIGDAEVPATETRIATGHVSSTFSFKIEASDNKKFVKCAVNNSMSLQQLNAEVQLNVFFPPQNVTISFDPLQPKDGDLVTFTCWTSSSNPSATIAWWKDDNLMKGDPQLETKGAAQGGFSTRSRVTVSVTSADHRSTFVCEAKNSAFQSFVKQEVTLNVIHAPTFLTTGTTVELIEGKSGELNFTARSYPEVRSYRWSKGASFIPRMAHSYQPRPGVSTEGPFLYFSNVSRQDSGKYICIAQNAEGSTSGSVNLNILYPAVITNLTSNLTVGEGESFSIECSVDGNPLTGDTITWKYPNLIPSVSTSSDVGHSVLTVSNVTKNVAGLFECVAQNRVGPASVGTTKVIVSYRPTISKKSLERHVTAAIGESKELTCISDGYPDVTLKWSFNGSTVSSGSLKYIVRQNHDKSNEWRSTLLVKSITKRDYGVYTCVAMNSMGQDMITLHLLKRRLPVMDSSVSDPVSGDGSSAEFLPLWMWVAAVGGGLVVVANLLVCILFIRRKRGRRRAPSGGSLLCDNKFPLKETSGVHHEQCPDILKRDSCHCLSTAAPGKHISHTDVDITSTVSAAMYGEKECIDLSSEAHGFICRDMPSPPQTTFTTFQSKTELPIRRTIVGPKLETLINGHDDDS